MRKIKIIILILFMSLLCGCVKLNSEMTIYENGTLDMSILFATNNDLYSDLDIVTDRLSKNMFNKGYEVLPYNLNNYRGYTFEKTISHIDNISTDNLTSYDVGNFLYINSFVFKKTGNKYKAHFIIPKDDKVFKEYYYHVSSDVRNKRLESFDFIVNLPYPALSSNADSEQNNKKVLVWEFFNGYINDIEFEFELEKEEEKDNKTFLIVAILSGILLIILVVLIILKKKKNKKQNLLNEIVVNME